jgi:hypothetical protein
LKKIGDIRSSAELFGTREQVGENYLARAVGAWVGIYANQPEEFLGLHGFDREADGEPFSGKFKYTFTFQKDSFPPVGAFWSVTLYHFPSRFMYANEINRHLVNKIMVSGMIRNPDSSVTVLVQHQSPGKWLEPNWLPCPEGPFTMAFRTYLPGEAIRNGSYQPPMVKKMP